MHLQNIYNLCQMKEPCFLSYATVRQYCHTFTISVNAYSPYVHWLTALIIQSFKCGLNLRVGSFCVHVNIVHYKKIRYFLIYRHFKETNVQHSHSASGGHSFHCIVPSACMSTLSGPACCMFFFLNPIWVKFAGPIQSATHAYSTVHTARSWFVGLFFITCCPCITDKSFLYQRIDQTQIIWQIWDTINRDISTKWNHAHLRPLWHCTCRKLQNYVVLKLVLNKNVIKFVQKLYIYT